MIKRVLKRAALVLLPVILAIVGIIVASCDTTVVDDETGLSGAPCSYYTVSPDGNYLAERFVNGCYLFNKQTNEWLRLDFGDDESLPIRHLNAWHFEGDTLRVQCHGEKPTFDEDTGMYAYSRFYPVTYVFNMEGKLLSRDASEPWIPESEADTAFHPAELAELRGIEHIVSLLVSNSVYDRHEHEASPLSERLNETETEILRYVYEKYGVPWEATYKESYYELHVSAKRIGDKIWFSHSYGNKKNWASQRGVWSGRRHAGVSTYDEMTGEFEDILTLGRKTEILSFTDKTILYYQKGHLYARDVASGKRKKLSDLPETAYFCVLDDRLFVHGEGITPLTLADAVGEPLVYSHIFDLDGELLRKN